MPSLDHILSRVVERKGYQVQGSDGEGLLARKGEESLLVAWKTDGPLATADVHLFTTALEQVNATRGILVAARGTDAGVREQAANDKRLEVWAESRLVVEVGEALVKDAIEARANISAVAQQVAAVNATYTAPAGPNANVSGAAPTASRPPAQRFPSLISTAVSLTNGDNRGAAYYMPSKPKAPAAPVASDAPLRYAWSGISGANVDPGVAQVRNGRRPTRAGADTVATLPEHRDVEIVTTPRRPRPEPEAPTRAPVLVSADDVELIETPRRRAAPEPAPAPNAEAEAAPQPLVEPAPILAAPEPAVPAPIAAPILPPAPVTLVETEEYEIISSPRRRPNDDA